MNNPFQDASHLWHMNDDRPAAGGLSLEPHGEVELGVELSGAERADSLARGGDGRAARIRGGRLSLAGDAAMQFGRSAFAVAIRMKDLDGAWLHPILGSDGGDAQVSLSLRALDGRTMPMQDRNLFGVRSTIYAWMFKPGLPRSIDGCQSLLEVIWGADEVNAARRDIQLRFPERDYPLLEDIQNAVMKICCPVQRIGAKGWHDIVVCFTGPKLLLYVDGVLVDEEYPIGATRDSTQPFRIGAGQAGQNILVDHVAVWDRALTADEVAAISGGPQTAARRELEILGPPAKSMQYFRPRGHNSKAGDCIPFWHDGTFHLFYLILRRNMHSKWDGGHGGLEIWQATTRDLKTWTHHPVTIPISEQWEAWNGTGGVAVHDGVYHWYYPCPCYDKKWPHHGIQLATSTDGIHFTKQDPHPFLYGGDCEVYTDAAGTYHLIRYGERTDKTIRLDRLTSPDLRTWTPAAEPFIETDSRYCIEMCPNLFKMGDWYYFMGGMNWWRSRGEFGPWEEHHPRSLDNMSVPKVARFGEGRYIYAGFLEDGGWGGNLILRELVQNSEGILGVKFVPELIPPCSDDLPAQLALTLKAADQRAKAVIPNIAGDVRITMTIVPQPGVKKFGLRLRGGAQADDGCELAFDPINRTAVYSAIVDSAGTNWGTPGIHEVDDLDKPFEVDIICRNDIIDAELMRFRTVTTRFWNPAGDRVQLFAEGGEVTFRDIRIRSLHEP
ncbi:MAG: LamG-like jellyroll fold domain-containing protein [Phycisphaerae bacterium]